ncbi:MAG: T9SS type A sorting domain-containing protein [Mariniphaga sp.]|nr:T9SS type A sorting domain-containing protein [Mariniphaga sp.]
MKKKYYILNLSFILLLISINVITNAQGTVKTPMNQTVYVLSDYDNPTWIALWEADAADWIDDNNSGAVRIGAATSNYNCHSYAWHVSDGGNSGDCWMNYEYGGSNLSKYWTNDSYSSTYSIGNYKKLFYGTSANHSAITTDQTGVVKSKWGTWPLYRHGRTDCPYENPSFTYYEVPISGPDYMCSSDAETFSIVNISGADYSWTGSEVSVGGSSYSTTATSGAYSRGLGYVKADVSDLPSGTTIKNLESFYIDGPDYEDVSFSLYTSGGTPVSYMCPNTHYHIYVNNNSGCSTSNYSWTVPAAWTVNYTWSNMISIYTNSTPGGNVMVDASTCCSSCGAIRIISDYFGSGYCGGMYSMVLSPNPTAGETTISLQATLEDIEFDEDAEWEVEVYSEIQVLKEKKVKLKGNKHKIKTQDWKEGIYYIRVFYKDEIITGKLVVK